jgi:hypothetical protein
MNKYKLVNNIGGWIAFAIALTTYLLTIEPTASFWDCGEFISCAYKLDVGHPPGAPFFMLIGRFFATFASDPTKVAMMINAMSATFSALTILFLFWTITHLAKKTIIKKGEKASLAQLIGIMGAGLVGSMAYTFSDTFWFSAVEGEVYAFSSLFTAVVFWAILKWEDVANEPHSDRWLIFIAYMMGLSIGVHLLNLLAIPAIVLVYYFKKHTPTAKGIIGAMLVACIILAGIMYGFIPGSVKVAGWFELFFINNLGFKYNTGALMYMLTVFSCLSWGIYETYKGNNISRMKILFLVSIVLLGIPFIGDSWILPLMIIGGLIYWVSSLNITQKVMNTILLSLLVLFIGYSSYTVTVIRSVANPAMDQNGPDNVFALKNYLNREQYGDRPLFYGQYYNSEVKLNIEGNYCVPETKETETIWIKDTVENGKNRYISAGKKFKYVYDSKLTTFFPRMYSDRKEHIEAYNNWGNIKGRAIQHEKCGRTMTINKPTFGENLQFFFSYQVNFMYWRYFMWNFVGRQNDIQGHGEVHKGNWISGIDFIDNILVGDQTSLPDDLANNKARNTYFFLPLLLGLIGLLFQLYSGKKGIESFWLVFTLFILTGIAIVVYLNQTPYQPRERDYAYAGSFYAFSIWIGLGVLGLIQLINKYVPKNITAIVVSIATLGVPVLMASENWDDHDRSNRRTVADFGYNYLMSCEPNAILFTNGDNDTFPLWYMQEVEGVRTDVRVCNLSYLQTDWYIDQMKRGYYDSEALPIKMKRSKYAENTRIASMVNSQSSIINEAWLDKPIELGVALDFYLSDDPRAKDNSGNNFMPSQLLYINVDSNQVLKTKTIKPEEVSKIEPILPIKLDRRIIKNELAILDMLRNNNWERPIYYAVTVGGEANLGLKDYSRNEGLARRIVPIKQPSGGGINTDAMYENMVHKFRWGGIDNPKVYLDETNLRMCSTFRIYFGYLAAALINEGKKEKALETLDYCMKVIPTNTVPSDYLLLPIAEYYYALGENKKADDIIIELAEKSSKNLRWFFNLEKDKMGSTYTDIYENLSTAQQIVQITEKNNKALFDKYYQSFMQYFELYSSLK